MTLSLSLGLGLTTLKQGGGHLAGYSLWASDAYAAIKRWCSFPSA